MKCRDCGTDNTDDTSLCVKCGATLPSISGQRAQIPEESLEALLAVLCVIGFLMIVAGALLIGGTFGAGMFLAIFGAVLLIVTFVYYVPSRKP